jgi:DNA-binding NarL/FixJ family response regulator
MARRRARIVLADQQTLFRQSLAAHLVKGGYMVVCEAADSAALDQCIIEDEPDIVVLDRYLPGIDALEYCQILNALQPQIQVLILVAYEHEARGLQSTAFIAGAAGCLSKELEPQVYLTAIRQLLDGHVLFPPDAMRRAARQPKVSGPAARIRDLTQRELEILVLVAEGMGNREIAKRLDISYHTAMKHVSNIISKLKVSNRMQAGLVYIRHGRNGSLPGLHSED